MFQASEVPSLFLGGGLGLYEGSYRVSKRFCFLSLYGFRALGFLLRFLVRVLQGFCEGSGFRIQGLGYRAI